MMRTRNIFCHRFSMRSGSGATLGFSLSESRSKACARREEAHRSRFRSPAREHGVKMTAAIRRALLRQAMKIMAHCKRRLRVDSD